MEPQEITQAEAADLLASGFETGRYEPLGLFLVGEAGGTWTGIDNSTGHAWTEEFGTKAECLEWLKGENEVGEEAKRPVFPLLHRSGER